MQIPDVDDLQTRLLQAHADRDQSLLVALYTVAADAAEARDRPEAASFYLTHAYVYALETGAQQVGSLHIRLRELGCEE